MAYQNLGQQEKAMNDLSRCTGKDETGQEATYCMGYILYNSGDYHQSFLLFKNAAMFGHEQAKKALETLFSDKKE